MNNSLTLDSRIVEAVRKAVPKPYVGKKLLPETDLVNEVEIDSLRLMILTVELEKAFDISIAANMDKFLTVITLADLHEFIYSLTNEV